MLFSIKGCWSSLSLLPGAKAPPTATPSVSVDVFAAHIEAVPRAPSLVACPAFGLVRRIWKLLVHAIPSGSNLHPVVITLEILLASSSTLGQPRSVLAGRLLSHHRQHYQHERGSEAVLYRRLHATRRAQCPVAGTIFSEPVIWSRAASQRSLDTRVATASRVAPRVISPFPM